jgi:hypothetical protein
MCVLLLLLIAVQMLVPGYLNGLSGGGPIVGEITMTIANTRMLTTRADMGSYVLFRGAKELYRTMGTAATTSEIAVASSDRRVIDADET